MNKATAASIYNAFSDEEKREVVRLKSSGLPGLKAVRQVHGVKLGDVTREAQPDLDAAESDPSFLENAAAFTQQAGKTLGMGLDDEVAGGLSAAASVFDGVPNNAFDAYEKGRDGQRDENDAIRRFAPTAAHAGELAATLGGAILPGGKAAKAVTSAPNLSRALLQGFGVGAGTGAVSGFGQDEGNVGENTVKGGLYGGVAGAVLSGVGAAANPAIRKGALDSAKGRIQGAKSSAGRVKPLDVMELISPERGKVLREIDARTATPSAEPQTLDDFVRSMPDDPVVPPTAETGSPLALDVAPFDPKAPPRFSNPGMSSMDDLMRAPATPAARLEFAAPADDLDGLVDARMAPDAPPVAPEPAGAAGDLDALLDANGTSTTADMVPEQAPGGLPDWMRNARAENWGTTPRPTNTGFDGLPMPEPSPSPAGLSAAEGSAVRHAKEIARSMPAVDPDGRQAAQVAATKQGSELKAVFEALPSGKRAGFIAQLEQQGMPAEVIRRRLGISGGGWKRTSMTRAQARAERNQADLVENLQSLQESP